MKILLNLDVNIFELVNEFLAGILDVFKYFTN